MTNKDKIQRKIDLRKLKYYKDIGAFDLGDGGCYIYPKDELWIEIAKKIFEQTDRIFKKRGYNIQ